MTEYWRRYNIRFIVEIFPGDHGSFMTPQLAERIQQEMTDHFAASQKAFLKANPLSAAAK